MIFRRLVCRKKEPRRAHRRLAPGVWRHPITLRSLVVRSTALTQGGGWVGGVHFQKVLFFNYFRHNKSEPDSTDDCICTVSLIFLPNRFCVEMKPHELVWKSVTAILHRICVSIFMIFFSNFSEFGTRFPYLHIPDPKNVFLGQGTFWHVQ